ncbi:MAG TPA: hypothetical protein VNN62_16635, partial [Methylomirabilota bacterium]|nr:hypothetical protein [Methylomirabilota bacterium]
SRQQVRPDIIAEREPPGVRPGRGLRLRRLDAIQLVVGEPLAPRWLAVVGDPRHIAVVGCPFDSDCGSGPEPGQLFRPYPHSERLQELARY